MPDINGGYDKPAHAGSTRFGRNKEITDDFSMLQQAGQALAGARMGVSSGPLQGIAASTQVGDKPGKVVTTPGLSV